ncbi:hypothetical protein D770_11485 [Flammeovirgaceae bacterium 311]|nr:hypothetical protein D770_11485 [Flammeovirgaceae bacterium 311]
MENETTIAKYLWIIGSLIFIVLGVIHLYYTFFTDKFSSRNEKAIEEMKSSWPNLTKDTTLWKAWIGFNASHSSGAIFIGLVNFYLATQFYDLIRSEAFFYILNIVNTIFYLWLAKKYWFNIPFIGILSTLMCFVISFIITRFN